MVVGVGMGVMVGIVFFGSIHALGLLENGKKSRVEVAGEDVVFNYGKVGYIDRALSTYYIDKMEDEELVEGIYRGYVYGLEDPYTRYLTAEEFNKQKEESVGNYVGTGIKFTWGITNQHIIVTEVIENSPADVAGIQVGDKVTAIDGIPAMGSNETIIYEKLIYSGSNPVAYTVMNNAETEEREVVLQADLVEIELITSEMIESEVGYVVLDGLVKGSSEMLEGHLNKLKKEGATKFIIDIRDTYSDNIEEVLKLCDLFLDQAQVFTVKNYKDESIAYTTTDGKYGEPVVVLTSQQTQGALEAFVATMKESKRGTVVGEKTTGNGTVQEKVGLEDGSGLMITTGLIMTQKGELIKGEGVKPDIVQRPDMNGTLELVTTGILTKEHDVVLQKGLEVLTK